MEEIVQGVIFRSVVYSLATTKGLVFNDSNGASS
jgi:hydrogenase maturation factor HypF (carbamoyltransferase family)